MNDAQKVCNELFITSGEIVIIFMILPVLIALFYKKQFTFVLKIFWAYCIFTVLINLLELAYIYAVNNYTSFFKDWLVITDYSTNFFQIFHQLKTFALLGWFYGSALTNNINRNKIKILTIILILASILFYVFEKGWRNYGTVMPALTAIFSFALPFFYLWYLYKIDLALPLLKNSLLWFSLGLAVPGLIGLFLFFVGDAIQKEDFCLFTRYGVAKNVFEVIGQVLIAFGFSQARFAKYIHV